MITAREGIPIACCNNGVYDGLTEMAITHYYYTRYVMGAHSITFSTRLFTMGINSKSCFGPEALYLYQQF